MDRHNLEPSSMEILQLQRDEAMLQIASYETFQDGQVIFKEGDSGDWLYIVMDGEVEMLAPVSMSPL